MIGDRLRVDGPKTVIAYFSMEVGLDPKMPTYSGGLGVLAGDTLKAAADLAIPVVGVTLAHRKGYFRQRLDDEGGQTEQENAWDPAAQLEAVEPVVSISIEQETVRVRSWQYRVRGAGGGEVSVYFLDTDLPENSPAHRTLTDHLYGGDLRYRLCQEAVLGLGGVALLRALGITGVHAFHMNEGHSALLGLSLMEEVLKGTQRSVPTDEEREAVRQRCVFTTHTPVPAGHDQFPLDLVNTVLGPERSRLLCSIGGCPNESLNMTYLALSQSRYVNGVAMRHGQISRGMFPDYPIDSITNGVHAGTWVSAPFATLFDKHIPGWRTENMNLRYAVGIPVEEIRHAHAQAKKPLMEEIRRRTNVELDPAVLTIGFARRATAYKRADLVLRDLERLKQISSRVGPLQIVYAGKAHPRDQPGKSIIRRIFEAARLLRDSVPVVYLEDYDMELGKLLCSGVDLWLNTPQKPNEASGTSGMKAALNGVPSLSVLDGWWIEGHVEGVTGWSIGETTEPRTNVDDEAHWLHDKLEHAIVPMFYGRPQAFGKVMRAAISLNGSFFNAERMVFQYLQTAYRRRAHS